MARIRQTTSPTATAPAPAPAPASDHEPWLPQTAAEAASTAPRLGVRPPALLRWHPERWTVLQGQVVPQCASVPLRVGVQRVRQRSDGRYLLRETVADLEERGWRVLPADVDGPGTSYLWEAAPGAYLTRWEQPHAASSVVSSDLPAYVAWLRGLVDRGVIPRPQPYVLERMAARLERQIADLSDRASTTPSVVPTLRRYEADLAAVRAELATVRTALPVGPPAPPDALLAEESP